MNDDQRNSIRDMAARAIELVIVIIVAFVVHQLVKMVV